MIDFGVQPICKGASAAACPQTSASGVIWGHAKLQAHFRTSQGGENKKTSGDKKNSGNKKAPKKTNKKKQKTTTRRCHLRLQPVGRLVDLAAPLRSERCYAMCQPVPPASAAAPPPSWRGTWRSSGPRRGKWAGVLRETWEIGGGGAHGRCSRLCP